MRMLRNLPHQRLAIGVGHPVLGLNELVRRHPRLEGRDQLRIIRRLNRLDVLREVGCVHEVDVALPRPRFKLASLVIDGNLDVPGIDSIAGRRRDGD